MRLFVAQTGSAGNTYILSGDDGESLILDAGAPVKSVLPHIPNVRKVRGLLLTHEHGDHVRHWYEYGKKGVMVYGSIGTLTALNPKGPFDMCSLTCKRAIIPNVDWLRMGAFTVGAFPTQHDAEQPTGFLIRYNPTGEQIMYATDTYYLAHTFPGITYWIIECNYCEDLIEAETDLALRSRLLESHMSLRRLVDTLSVNDLSKTAKIVLVHLSDKRSDEARMIREVSAVTDAEVVAAHNGDDIELSRTPF